MNDRYINDAQGKIGDGLTLIAAALGIGIEAVRAIHTPDHSHHGWTLPVLATVVVVKLVISNRVQKHRHLDDNQVNTADLWQHLRDAATSGAAFVGISIALIGGDGWELADDWASLAAALVMGCSGVAVLLSALRGSIQSRHSGRTIATIRSVAMSVPQVLAVEKLVVRQSTNATQVIIDVQLLPTTLLSQAHDVSGRVTSAIRGALPGAVHVLVHLEPYDSQ